MEIPVKRRRLRDLLVAAVCPGRASWPPGDRKAKEPCYVSSSCVKQQGHVLSESINEVLPNEVVSMIIKAVSLKTGSLSYSLVCKQWHATSCQAQASVRIRPGTAIPPATLLMELEQFSGIELLRLHDSSTSTLPEVFLQSFGGYSSKLTHFRLAGHLAQRWRHFSSLPAAGVASALALKAFLENNRSLQTLDLKHIMYELPSLDQHLTHLKWMEISFVCGHIANFSSFPNLQRLKISTISPILRLSESIGCLLKLKVLILYVDELAELPDSMGNLASLEVLTIFSDGLLSLPETCMRLQKLRKLTLSCRNLQQVPDFQHLPLLHTAFFYRFPDWDTAVQKVSRCPTLESLRIKADPYNEKNQVSATVALSILSRLKSLRRLTLVKLHGPFLPHMRKVSPSVDIWLSCCAEVETVLLPKEDEKWSNLIFPVPRGSWRIKDLANED